MIIVNIRIRFERGEHMRWLGIVVLLFVMLCCEGCWFIMIPMPSQAELRSYPRWGKDTKVYKKETKDETSER